ASVEWSSSTEAGSFRIVKWTRGDLARQRATRSIDRAHLGREAGAVVVEPAERDAVAEDRREPGRGEVADSLRAGDQLGAVARSVFAVEHERLEKAIRRDVRQPPQRGPADERRLFHLGGPLE